MLFTFEATSPSEEESGRGEVPIDVLFLSCHILNIGSAALNHMCASLIKQNGKLSTHEALQKLPWYIPSRTRFAKEDIPPSTTA